MSSNDMGQAIAHTRIGNTQRQKVRYFVSFCRKDVRLKKDFLERLEPAFGSARDYSFVGWEDKDIELGELWHEQIQTAIAECDFGLLLISPAFLASEYIQNHELPHFVSPGTQPSVPQKKLIPVALRKIDFETMNTRGLEKHQIYHDKIGRAYSQLTSRPQKDEFVDELYRRVIRQINGMIGSARGTILSASLTQKSAIETIENPSERRQGNRSASGSTDQIAKPRLSPTRSGVGVPKEQVSRPPSVQTGLEAADFKQPPAVSNSRTVQLAHPNWAQSNWSKPQPCRFYIVKTRYRRRRRWNSYADILVEIIEPADHGITGEAYLFPSVSVHPDFRDADHLKSPQGHGTLRQKKNASEKFILQTGDQPLEGAFFAMATKSGAKAVGVYCAAYDSFLKENASAISGPIGSKRAR